MKGEKEKKKRSRNLRERIITRRNRKGEENNFASDLPNLLIPWESYCVMIKKKQKVISWPIRRTCRSGVALLWNSSLLKLITGISQLKYVSCGNSVVSEFWLEQEVQSIPIPKSGSNNIPDVALLPAALLMIPPVDPLLFIRTKWTLRPFVSLIPAVSNVFPLLTHATSVGMVFLT